MVKEMISSKLFGVNAFNLQVNKLANYSFIDNSRKYETPGTEQRTLLQHRGQYNFQFAKSPFAPPYPWYGAEKGPGEFCTHSAFVMQQGTTVLDNSFKVAPSKPIQTLTWREVFSSLPSTINKSVPWLGVRNTLQLSRSLAPEMLV